MATRVATRVRECIYQRRRSIEIILERGKRNPKELLAITDPYCPAVRATTPNDTPFVVKSGEELPAVGEG